MPRPYRTPGVGPHAGPVRRHEVPDDSDYGRFLVAARRELAEQIGGDLTITQQIMIDRVAWLRLHVSLFDEAAGKYGGVMKDRDRKSYLAFSNSLARALKVLGVPPAIKRPIGRPRNVRQPTVAMTDILGEAAE